MPMDPEPGISELGHRVGLWDASPYAYESCGPIEGVSRGRAIGAILPGPLILLIWQISGAQGRIPRGVTPLKR